MPGHLVLLGGPAGAGKTTLAAAWCRSRRLAVQIQLDEIRSMIVSGLLDPQGTSSSLKGEQYDLSAKACCTLAQTFVAAGYDVAIDDVLEPSAFARAWQPALDGVSYSMLIVRPSLEEVLGRASRRKKRVREDIIRRQYRDTEGWPDSLKLDTTALTVEESLELARAKNLLP